MDYKINDISVSEKEMEVTYEYNEIKSNIESEIREQVKKIQIPGFRKGKVPFSLLKKMYGDSLEFEASQEIATVKFWELVKDNQLHPIGKPSLMDVNFKAGENFSFKIKFEVYPEINVENYTGNEIEIPKFVVKDEDIQKEIDSILEENRTTEPTGIIGNDNNYLIVVELTKMDDNGNIIPDIKPHTLQMDFTESTIRPTIIENARGKKIGEYFNFSFTKEKPQDADDKNETNVIETFNYKAELKDIKKIIKAELTEDLIKKVTKNEISNEQDLRDSIKERMQDYYDELMNDLTVNKLIGLIIKNNDFPPPQSIIQKYLNELIKKEDEETKLRGYKDIDETKSAESLESKAEDGIKWYFIKHAIVEKEGIEIPDDELRTLAGKESEKNGIAVDKLLDYYKSSDIEEKLIEEKLFKFLKEKNIIKEVDPDEILNKEPEVVK